VLEFKRTSDQRRDYREGGESQAMTVLGHVEARLGHVEAVLGHVEAQHDILIRSVCVMLRPCWAMLRPNMTSSSEVSKK
jgi:hypothetical protein